MENENNNVQTETPVVAPIPGITPGTTPNPTPIPNGVPNGGVNPIPVGTENKNEEKREKNDGRKKVLAAFLMLVVTAISLTTASYAWFTENTTVSIDSITVNVSASNGIQISTDAVTWKGNITNTDITGNAYTGHHNQMPGSLVPSSTGGNVNTTTGFMDMYTGSLEVDATTTNGYRLISTKANDTAAVASGGFIAFDFFILVSGTQNTTVYLTTGSDVVTSGTDSGLKNAARVAFLYEGNATAGASAAAILLHGADSHKTASQTTNILWEPNSNAHTSSGQAQAANYGQTITTNTVVTNYYGLIAESVAADSLDYQSTAATHFLQVTPDIQTPVNNLANGEYHPLFTLLPGINKIRVYGWVEGQDYDCENDASGSGITFNLAISKNSAP